MLTDVDAARRIFLAGQQYCLDLSDHGNSNPGTPVTLWKKWEGGTNQTWRFEDGESSSSALRSRSPGRISYIHAMMSLA